MSQIDYQGLGCKPNILVVEDDLQWRQDHQTNLKRWGYNVYIAEGFGEELINDAKEKARRYQCHLALVDMCLFDDIGYDKSGLELLPDLRPAKSVIVTAFGNHAVAVEALKQQGAVDFVGKEEGPERLRNAIYQAIRNQCACSNSACVAWSPNLNPSDIKEHIYPQQQVAGEEICDILGRLFPEATKLKLEELRPGKRYTSMAPRKVVIFKIWVDNLEPFVIKLGRADSLRKEVNNYERYVKDKLVRRPYARLKNSQILWDFGAAVYELFDTVIDELQLFSEFYVTSSFEKINTALEHFFCNIWQRPYAEKSAQEVSMFQAYTAVWGKSWHDRIKEYPYKSDTLTLPAIDKPLKNPITWLSKNVSLDEPLGQDKSYFDNAWQAVTHGDLQGDNMFVGSLAYRVRLIDYERTGVGPILQDFVQLEVDILTRLAQFTLEDTKTFYDLMLIITQPNDPPLSVIENINSLEATKTYMIIRNLRQYAVQQTGVTDVRQYLWGLLLNAVFRATLLFDQDKEGGREYQHSLILGSVICDQLESAILYKERGEKHVRNRA